MLMAIQFIILLVFIFIGARLGSLGIGLAGGAGVIVLALTGLDVHPMPYLNCADDLAENCSVADAGIPWDVIGIIMAVIMCIATMQAAGGLEMLVETTEKVLRKNPKRITFYAPIVAYLMTFFCGTGHVAFSSLPVIAEVAKETNIAPKKPLSISVVASQVSIAASPVAAAMIAMAGVVEPMGVSYPKLVLICFIITFIGTLVGAFVANMLGPDDLNEYPEYVHRKNAGLIKMRGEGVYNYDRGPAKMSIIIFAVALVCVIIYALAISKNAAGEALLLSDPPLDRNSAIMTFMMAAGMIMIFVCKVKADEITSQATFRGGMSAAACILGVAWVGNTFVQAYTGEIKEFAGEIVGAHPWVLSIVIFFASALLYSQGATTKALMPAAAEIVGSGGAATLVASFPAVTGLFILPTYPTSVAAVEFDDTGTTKIGKYVFNHPFIVPGTVTVFVSVIIGFLVGKVMI